MRQWVNIATGKPVVDGVLGTGPLQAIAQMAIRAEIRRMHEAGELAFVCDRHTRIWGYVDKNGEHFTPIVERDQ